MRWRDPRRCREWRRGHGDSGVCGRRWRRQRRRHRESRLWRWWWRRRKRRESRWRRQGGIDGAMTAALLTEELTTMVLAHSALVIGAEFISSSEISMSSPEEC